MAEQKLAGKIALITGANTGIGRATAEALARRGAHTILACRSKDKAMAVVEAINQETAPGRASFLKLDLGSLSLVKESAQELLKSDRQVDILVNNAGLAGHQGITADGFELAFGTNHIGHFAFTLQLLPALLLHAKKDPVRIINVASKSHYDAAAIDFEAVRKPTDSTTGLPEYAVSKLANVLFSAELHRRYHDRGIGAYSLHPGVVASDVWRRVPWPIRSVMKMFMISNEKGAETTVHCAGSDSARSGAYFDDSKEREPSALAKDEALAAELWKKSEDWVSLTAP